MANRANMERLLPPSQVRAGVSPSAQLGRLAAELRAEARPTRAPAEPAPIAQQAAAKARVRPAERQALALEAPSLANPTARGQRPTPRRSLRHEPAPRPAVATHEPSATSFAEAKAPPTASVDLGPLLAQVRQAEAKHGAGLATARATTRELLAAGEHAAALGLLTQAYAALGAGSATDAVLAVGKLFVESQQSRTRLRQFAIASTGLPTNALAALGGTPSQTGVLFCDVVAALKPSTWAESAEEGLAQHDGRRTDSGRAVSVWTTAAVLDLNTPKPVRAALLSGEPALNRVTVDEAAPLLRQLVSQRRAKVAAALLAQLTPKDQEPWLLLAAEVAKGAGVSHPALPRLAAATSAWFQQLNRRAPRLATAARASVEEMAGPQVATALLYGATPSNQGKAPEMATL